uniref:Uncharacterized protein n=1 Tax=Cairina moschata TaxID=8855 RepID=A0A8C3BX63_CAIMO
MQHHRAWGRVLPQAHPVPLLREHRRVVVGIGDVDAELGGAAPGRLPAVQRRQHQAQARFALPVQRAAQHQLRELAAVLALPHFHREVPVGLQLVALQGVRAHVRIFGDTQGKAGAGRSQLVDFQLDAISQEARRVVVNVLDGHFDVENVQRVLHHHLETDGAGRRLAAQLLPVQPPAHVQVPVLAADGEVVLLRADPQLACRQLGWAQPHVPRQRPHQRAPAQLLGDRVAEPLRRRPPTPFRSFHYCWGWSSPSSCISFFSAMTSSSDKVLLEKRCCRKRAPDPP